MNIKSIGVIKLAKYYYLKLFKEGRFIKSSIRCQHTWLGNDYGGFFVCDKLLNQQSIVYSFGIGCDISFSSDLISKYGCTVYAFDPTPKSVQWVHRQPLPKGFVFTDCGISSISGLTKFFLPKNPKFVSGSIINHSNVSQDEFIMVKMSALSDIAQKLKHDKIDILKIDIEGFEYEVLDSILDSGLSIDQILIEFHYRFIPDGKEKTIAAIKKLNNYGYEIFAISRSFNEVSFIKREILN